MKALTLPTSKPYSRDLSEGEWALLEPLAPAIKSSGRLAHHSRREIVNAILYAVQSGNRLLDDFQNGLLGRREPILTTSSIARCYRLTATILLRSAPMASIADSITSPGWRYSGGVRPWPTPAGVPVAMMSPGSSVITSESDAMMVATS